MATYLNFSQLLVSLLLIVTILIQVRGVGSGLFGSVESTYRTRRGVERTLFRFTIVLAVLFVIISLLSFRYS